MRNADLPFVGRHHHKVRDSVAAALDGLDSGMTVMVGGFGLCGIPEFLIAGLQSAGADNVVLKLISPLRPGLLESADGSGFLYLIMPIRLNV